VRRFASCLVGAALGLGAPARAEPLALEASPRLVDLSTAAHPRAWAHGGISHRGEASLSLGVGLGTIAAVGGGYDDRLAVGASAATATSHAVPTAWFRIAVPHARWSPYQPALALDLERSFAAETIAIAELRLLGTQQLTGPRVGRLALTIGASLWDVQAGDAPALGAGPLRAQLRPALGLGWNPVRYPRTTVLAELAWAPTVVATTPRLDARFGWGVRYQALSWATIDLVVRHREAAGLEGSTVMLRAAIVVP